MSSSGDTIMPNKLNRVVSAICAVAATVLMSAVLVTPASAAPTFGVSIEDLQAKAGGGLFSLFVVPDAHGPIGRSDKFAFYKVAVRNTAPTTATCNHSTWSGTPAPTFAYRWLRDGSPIVGAEVETYAPTAGDVGHTLQCQVTATNAGGASAQVSAPLYYGSAPVNFPPPAPSNPLVEAARPTVSGTTERTCVAPTNWIGAPSFTYQWLRNGSPIVGATTEKYTPKGGVGEEDQNKVLQCMVIGKNASGTAAGISSNVNIGTPTTPPANTAGSNPTTTGAEWTSGTTIVSLGVPKGILITNIRQSEAVGWTCSSASGICRTTQGVAPGASYNTIMYGVNLLPEAPESPVATVYASGGGATKEEFAQDTFTFAPPIPFALNEFKAAAFEEGGGEIESFQAGSHPFSGSVRFRTPANHLGFAVEDLHEVWTDLPVGFVGNPQSVAVSCALSVFEAGKCPQASAAGTVKLAFNPELNLNDLADATPDFGLFSAAVTVYRLQAEKGFPAEFGFRYVGPFFIFRAKVRTESDYGITIIAPKNPQLNYEGGLQGAKFTFCGTGLKKEGGCYHSNETGANAQPLMTIGTKCFEGPPVTSLALDTWQKQGANLPNGRPDLSDPHWFHASYPAPPVTGCNKLVEQWTGDEEPSLTVQPDNTNADTPAGYTAHLHIPQEGLTDPNKLANSDLNNVKVTLAEGPTLNPSVGDGISTCSEAQMEMISESPIRFEEELPHCPDGSKIGNALVRTPLLENPLRGSIYLAAQKENPFDSDYAIYLAIEEPDAGIVVKLAGKVVANPVTGQLTTVFTDNPELPFEDLTLEFFNGGRSSLANPTTCGAFTTHTELTPWAAADPYNPLPDEIAKPDDPIAIVSGPNGSSCSNTPAERPFNLDMESGSENAKAGEVSPFHMRITRPDGSQEISQLTVKSPPGYAAYLKGIPQCSDAQIKEAENRSGLAEREHSSCPANSRLGSINSGAGAGPTPLFTPGSVYLGGPYKGAPLSLVTVTPALAGADKAHPSFDLGNVVVRVALYVNRQNAQITGKTDQIPRIIKGIPLRIRDIRVNLDRPNFGLNPTNCDVSATSVTASGSEGATTTVSDRFQVGGCDKLNFAPKLTAKVTGGTQRGDHPAFTAELNYPPGGGYANIKDVQVALPHSEFLDQSHINTICTRVQAAANACPQGSIYGYAEAETPLLDGKLTGPVFLKSSDHQLPDLAIALKGPAGQPVEVEFQGRIDSVHAQIRNTIEGLPDVPVTKFILKMKGGKKGLLVNSRNLCQGKPGRMTVNMSAQNNKPFDTRPTLGNSCGKAKKGKKHHKRSRQLSQLVGGW